MCCCMKYFLNYQDNNDEYNQILYLFVIFWFCYCVVVGVVDGGCVGCLYYYVEFFGGNVVFNFVYDQVYFIFVIIILVIG